MCTRGTVLTKKELAWYAKQPEYNDMGYRSAEAEFLKVLNCTLNKNWWHTVVFNATTGQEVCVIHTSKREGDGRPLEERVAVFLEIKVS